MQPCGLQFSYSTTTLKRRSIFNNLATLIFLTTKRIQMCIHCDQYTKRKYPTSPNDLIVCLFKIILYCQRICIFLIAYLRFTGCTRHAFSLSSLLPVRLAGPALSGWSSEDGPWDIQNRSQVETFFISVKTMPVTFPMVKHRTGETSSCAACPKTSNARIVGIWSWHIVGTGT